MPSDMTTPQTPAQPSTKDAILAKLKSLGDSTTDFVKKNPELVAGTAAAGMGGLIGGKATGTAAGALTGAAVGGGLTAALSNILKSPPPGAADDAPVPEHSKKVGAVNLAGTFAQHPFYTAGGVTAGLYGLRKATPDSVKEIFTGGLHPDTGKDWTKIEGIIDNIRKDATKSPEEKLKLINAAMKPYLHPSGWSQVKRAASGEPEFWDTLVKKISGLGKAVK